MPYPFALEEATLQGDELKAAELIQALPLNDLLELNKNGFKCCPYCSYRGTIKYFNLAVKGRS